MKIKYLSKVSLVKSMFVKVNLPRTAVRFLTFLVKLL
nr:MAG TPA: hypothetical protein [Caudoviricetes sp.]DAR22293.1 MAG TPA: hypothetical protein [Caudoviricetes sp.]